MKKILLFVSLTIFIETVYGQLSNGSFETWNSTSYDEPTGWQTGNHEAISLGLIPVTRTNGPSGYAVRMQTIVSNGDTAQAYIANGDPMGGQGGIPYSQMATAITGAYRYNLPGNDTALILVIFKSNGIIISQNLFKIHGTGSQTNWATFNFPISLANTPDSVIIAATCSNLIDNVGIENGSFLELDAMSLVGPGSPAFSENFENWTTNTNDVISGWETYGGGISKTQDAYDGLYAISLTTVDYGNGNISSSGMTNGHNTQNGSVGGMPFSLNADTLTGYYKYFTTTSDSANIGVSLMLNSNNISGNGKFLPATSQYTYFEVPVYSPNMPDTMRIDISSSKWPFTQGSVGSTLYIDHLQLKSAIAAGIKNVDEKKSNIFAYPNPAKDLLHISLAKNNSENVLVEIYDLTGRLIMKEIKSVADNSVAVRISSLKTGRYFYRVTGNGMEYKQPFSKE